MTFLGEKGDLYGIKGALPYRNRLMYQNIELNRRGNY